jgi:hypothetical protein
MLELRLNKKNRELPMNLSFAHGWRFWLLHVKAQWCILTAGALVLLTMLAGCASKDSGNYATLKQTDSHVSWEMTRFRNAEIWGHLTADEKERGNAAYTASKKAFAEAVRAANGNKHAPTPENVEALANEAIRVLSTLPTEQR